MEDQGCAARGAAGERPGHHLGETGRCASLRQPLVGADARGRGADPRAIQREVWRQLRIRQRVFHSRVLCHRHPYCSRLSVYAWSISRYTRCILCDSRLRVERGASGGCWNASSTTSTLEPERWLGIEQDAKDVSDTLGAVPNDTIKMGDPQRFLLADEQRDQADPNTSHQLPTTWWLGAAACCSVSSERRCRIALRSSRSFPS
jgi:hypothetical protein